MGLHVIIVGNPVDGITILGPFKTAGDAVVYADTALKYGSWWIAPLQEPEA